MTRIEGLNDVSILKLYRSDLLVRYSQLKSINIKYDHFEKKVRDAILNYHIVIFEDKYIIKNRF